MKNNKIQYNKMTNRSAYTILKISPDASFEQIINAWDENFVEPEVCARQISRTECSNSNNPKCFDKKLNKNYKKCVKQQKKKTDAFLIASRVSRDRRRASPRPARPNRQPANRVNRQQ